MVDDTEIVQAKELLAALHEQVQDISRKLEVIERRGPHKSARGASHYRGHRNELRRDLYEAHRHIDGIHRRFPATRAEASNSSHRHARLPKAGQD